MKKFMTIIAAAMLVLALTGCDTLGKGKTKGTKWKKTMTVDGTSITTTFRRFIKPLSNSRKVKAIKTTIAIDEDSILKSDASGKERYAVVGLAIDFHSDGAGNNKKYDMVLIGFQPEGKKFYIEKYENVSADGAKSADTDMDDETEDLGESGFDTNAGSMNGDKTAENPTPYISFYNDGNKTTFSTPVTIGTTCIDDDWMAAPAGSYNADGENGFEIYVQVKQADAGIYDIYLGETKVATYEGAKKDTDGMAIGGAAVYANTPKGTKVTVKYISDKDPAVTIGLFADEEDF